MGPGNGTVTYFRSPRSWDGELPLFLAIPNGIYIWFDWLLCAGRKEATYGFHGWPTSVGNVMLTGGGHSDIR